MNASQLSSPLTVPEQIAISAWYWLVLVLCLLGNGFVLVASIRYRAIKLDPLSLWLIQNLAVTDMCHGIFHVLPTVITTTAGYQWVLGPGLCTSLFIIRYMFIDSNSFLINAMVINKLYRCLRPLSPHPRKRVKIAVSFVAFLGSNLYTISTIEGIISASEVEYVPYLIGCGIAPAAPTAAEGYALTDIILTILVVVVPSVTLVLLNTALVILAHCKGARGIKKANLVIIGLITLTYVSSNMPYFFWMLQFYDLFQVVAGRQNYIHYTRFVMLILQVSCFVNPIIYCANNKRFRTFTKIYLQRFITHGCHQGPWLVGVTSSHTCSYTSLPRYHTTLCRSQLIKSSPGTRRVPVRSAARANVPLAQSPLLNGTVKSRSPPGLGRTVGRSPELGRTAKDKTMVKSPDLRRTVGRSPELGRTVGRSPELGMTAMDKTMVKSPDLRRTVGRYPELGRSPELGRTVVFGVKKENCQQGSPGQRSLCGVGAQSLSQRSLCGAAGCQSPSQRKLYRAGAQSQRELCRARPQSPSQRELCRAASQRLCGVAACEMDRDGA